MDDQIDELMMDMDNILSGKKRKWDDIDQLCEDFACKFKAVEISNEFENMLSVMNNLKQINDDYNTLKYIKDEVHPLIVRYKYSCIDDLHKTDYVSLYIDEIQQRCREYFHIYNLNLAGKIVVSALKDAALALFMIIEKSVNES